MSIPIIFEDNKEPLVYFQVLGEENASSVAYVVRVKDLPDGVNVSKYLQFGRSGTGPWYADGKEISRDEYFNFDHDENTDTKVGDFIHGYLAHYAKYTIKDGKVFIPSVDEEIVAVLPVFEDI